MKAPVLLCVFLASCGGGGGNTILTPPAYMPIIEIFATPPAPTAMLTSTDTLIVESSGAVQGMLSKTQPVQAVFFASDPVTKLITPTAAADIASFLSAFKSASRSDPASVFIMDEMLWDTNTAPSQSEIDAMSASMNQIIALWRAQAPSVHLVVSIYPGLVVNPATSAQAISLLRQVDTVIFKPYVLFDPPDYVFDRPSSGALAWLYTDPEQALITTPCSTPISGSMEYDLTACATALVPGVQVGLAYQAFLPLGYVGDSSYLAQLEHNWTTVHTLADLLENQGRFYGSVVFGFNWAPGFASGQSFMTPAMIAALKSALMIYQISPLY
ncbi:MAG: hypothetical protein KGI47_07845 [Betaproteobacteria bacterium]|nr:hypothetical protein [Betaproteobacteria bacterium]MDE2623738.1 hypothetical protein [Betaproteobacteria bacterium]